MAFNDSTRLTVGMGATLGDPLLQAPTPTGARSHLAQPPRYVAPETAEALQERVATLESHLLALQSRIARLEVSWPLRLEAWLRRLFRRS